MTGEGFHVPRVTTGPLLNDSGDPAALDEDRLKFMKETIRNLQFQNPDEMVGPPRPEGGRERVWRLQREMVISERPQCGDVVERGIGHTKMLICNLYLGLGGDWKPPKP